MKLSKQPASLRSLFRPVLRSQPLPNLVAVPPCNVSEMMVRPYSSKAFLHQILHRAFVEITWNHVSGFESIHLLLPPTSRDSLSFSVCLSLTSEHS